MPPIAEAIGMSFFIFMVATGLALAGRRTGTLVLQKFSVAQKPQPDSAPSVEIVGRMQGLIGFVLSLMGLSPVTQLTIARGEVRYETSSLFGQKSQFVPLTRISGISAGVCKPITALMLAVAVIFISIVLSNQLESLYPLLVGWLIVMGCILYYALNKKFFIDLHASGAPTISLLLRPNVLEGVPIDVTRALAVVAVIRDLTLAASQPRSSPDRLPLAASFIPAAAMPDSTAEYVKVEDSYESNEVDDLDDATDADEEADEVEAQHLMAKARQYVQSGQRQQAITILQTIIRRFPMTTAAEQARRSLDKIGVR